MYPAALLAALEHEGVKLEPAGDTLRAYGPLSDQTRATISEHKPLLLSYLSMPPLIAAAYERSEPVVFSHVSLSWAVYLPPLMHTLAAVVRAEDTDNARAIRTALERASEGHEDAANALRAYLERPEVLERLAEFERTQRRDGPALKRAA